MKVLYKTKTAKEQEICAHLIECKDSFNPPLDQTVNILEYSNKIAQNAITFEAWDDQNLIGCVATYFNDDENHSGFITNVSVTKEFYGKGIASKLVRNCIKYAKENHFKEILLEVSKESKGAIHLYLKFGFQKIRSKNDNLIMKYKLN